MQAARRPLRLYLDSSDYSLLSDARRSELDAPGVLQCLRNHVAAGNIECFYSGAHLSEMAPTKPEYSEASEQRASLLVELCGKNVLVAHDRLFDLELRFALGMLKNRADPIRRDGEWFPEGAAELLPLSAHDGDASLPGLIGQLGRAERRKASKALLKGGRPRKHVQESLVKNARFGSVGEVLSVYPMNPSAARVLNRYVVGDATSKEATEAFQESLRDPRWMMKWFEQHHAELTPFIAWVRGPANELVSKLDAMSKSVVEARAQLSPEALTELLRADRWQGWQDKMLASIANRFAEKIAPGARLEVRTVDDCCAGLSVAVRSLHSAWRSITFETPRPPKPSDFPDAVHAAYAPYVDLFRADSFMAPHIARCAMPWGTVVVAKLIALPGAIEERLRAAA
jgi:hypothetical protein